MQTKIVRQSAQRALQLGLVGLLVAMSLPIAPPTSYKPPLSLPKLSQAQAAPSPIPAAPTAPAITPPSAPSAAAATPPEVSPESHPNYEYHALVTPNDPMYSGQWHLSTISAPAAWDITTGSPSQVVAVIDTGFSLSHQDLTDQWITNTGETGLTVSQGAVPNCISRGLTLDKSCNNLDDDGDGYIDNWRGWDFVHEDNAPQAITNTPSAAHGTFVAGLAASRGNNSIHGTGVSWNSRIMPLQVLDDNGTGYTNDVAAAVRYAADHGADVINLSLGSSFNDTYLRTQINYAINRGVVVVAAAGNTNCDCLIYPANFSEVIAVGASDNSDHLASFSSYGANLDIVAPGVNVCSTSWSSSSPNGYACGGSGTSYAAPLVAGAISLLLNRAGVTAVEAERIVRSGATVVSSMNGASFTKQYGYGRLNVYQTLLSATQPTPSWPLGDKSDPMIVQLSSQRDLSTNCHSLYTDCIIRLTGPLGQVVTVGPVSRNNWGDATIYWNPSQLGLSTGLWKLETVDSTPEQNITAPPIYIQINP